MKTLNDIYEYDYISGTSAGIFYPAMANNHIFPEDLRNPTMMSMIDFMYFSRSGDKYISPLVKSLDDKNYTKVEISNIINKLINVKYASAWTRLFDTWNLEYDPIENYRMIEEMTDDKTEMTFGKTHTRTDNLNHTRTDNLTHGKNLTETRTPNLHNESNNNIYGFNSNTNVPTGKQIDTATGTETIGNSGTETDTGTVTDADTGTVTDADTGKDTHVRNYELTRSGNIGVTTSQMMAESEIALWSKWEIFENVIFPAIDKLMTLPIY